MLQKVWRTIARLRPQAWENIEYFDEAWKDRIAALASLITEDEKIVLDLGCGPRWLRSMLSADKTYIGADYRDRGPGTFVCNFNQRQFPDVRADVCFVSGCLEYIEDVDWFLRRAFASAPALVLSYCTIDVYPGIRRRRNIAWVNHLTAEQLMQMACNCGYRLQHKGPVISGNQLFKFIRDARQSAVQPTDEQEERQL